MAEWASTKLADHVDVIHGYAFKGEFFSDEPPGDILLTPGNFAIGGGFQWNKKKYYRGGEVPSDYVLSPGDLLVTMTDLSKEADTLGYAAVVPISDIRLLHNQRLGKVVVRSSQINRSFLHWLLRSPDYRNEVLASYTGSTVKHTSPTKILAYEFRLPPMATQEAIGATLDALDDKIELNRRMNETLEAMARAIFRDWFVDFNPTRTKMAMRGEDPQSANVAREPYLAPDLWQLFPDRLDDNGIPEGWEGRPVGDFADLKGGKQLEKEYISKEGSVPVFGGAGVMGYTTNHNAEGFVISVGRVGAYCGQFFSHRGKAWINNNASLISQKEGVSGEWLFLALREADIDTIKKGAAQPFVSNGDIAAIRLVWPGEAILNEFARIAESLLQKNEQNLSENLQLAGMRDLLLPKLMSGEITLKDAEKKVGGAA